MTSNQVKPQLPLNERTRISAQTYVATAFGALIGFAASYFSLMLGVHGGPVLPAVLIDAPLILLYPHDDRGYLIFVVAGGTALYGAYGWLFVCPPNFLRRWAIVTVIAIIHVSAAFFLMSVQ